VEEVAALAEPHLGTGGANGATVLLAEDEEVVRRLVAEMLADAGYRVLSAEGGSGAIAVAEAAKERIDILLTDVVMPGVGGPELASLLLGPRPDLRVLYMLGYTTEAIASLGPGTAFLQKPFTRAQLVQALRKLGTEPLVA
jgi:CheY-like chemotaxis protein